MNRLSLIYGMWNLGFKISQTLRHRSAHQKDRLRSLGYTTTTTAALHLGEHGIALGLLLCVFVFVLSTLPPT